MTLVGAQGSVRHRCAPFDFDEGWEFVLGEQVVLRSTSGDEEIDDGSFDIIRMDAPCELRGRAAPWSTGSAGRAWCLIRPVPSWTDRLARFRGSVVCRPVDGGVHVRRRLEFWLSPALRPLLGKALNDWLAHDVPAEEIDGAGRVLEGRSTSADVGTS